MANQWTVRSPRDHIQLNDSLEELTELKKAITFTITVYSSERIQVKIAKVIEKLCVVKLKKKTGANFYISPPSDTKRTSLIKMWQHIQCLPLGKCIQDLVFRNFPMASHWLAYPISSTPFFLKSLLSHSLRLAIYKVHSQLGFWV